MRIILALALIAAASPGVAAVKSAAPSGFEIESRATVRATPAEAYAALGRIGRWWNSDHTYSGDAANLTLDLKAGGCFCEAIPADGGSIEHMRVVYARPGAALRLQGGLGPLQGEAVSGTLTWTLTPAAGGTEIVQTYIVGGNVRGGADKLAPLVDQVLAEQFSGFVKMLGQ